MQLKHNYYYFTSALTKSDCEKILNAGFKKLQEYEENNIDKTAVTRDDKVSKQKNDKRIPKNEKTLFQLKKEGKHFDDVYVRDSEVCFLNDLWLYDIISPYIKKANISAGWNFEIDAFEDLQFTVYKPGGFYSWHKDGGSDENSIYKRYISGVTDEKDKSYTTYKNYIGKVRKISMTLNLSPPEQYEGGDLLFSDDIDSVHYNDENFNNQNYFKCKEIKPQGSIIVFPSFLSHCVTPINKGVRYSLVCWCLGRPFK